MNVNRRSMSFPPPRQHTDKRSIHSIGRQIHPIRHPHAYTHKQAPTALLRLPLHLHTLQHPPQNLHSLGFWPRWLAAALHHHNAWASIPAQDLSRLPPALASFLPASDEHHTTLARPWLEAVLRQKAPPLSLSQWTEGLSGLSTLTPPSSSSSLVSFPPRIRAAIREAIALGDDTKGVPCLWAALAALGWLEVEGEEEGSLVPLLCAAAQRGMGG